MLDYPNGEEAAADGIMFWNDPMAYLQLNFPEYAQRLQAQQQQNAMLQMQNQAQATGMNTAAQNANTPPEATTEPVPELSRDSASSKLSQVPLPPLP